MRLLKAILWAIVAFWCPKWAMEECEKERFDNWVKMIVKGDKQ